MTRNGRTPTIPRSIKFDPEVRAKYKTSRDYWFNEDPVYRAYIYEQNVKWLANKKQIDPYGFAAKRKAQMREYNARRTLTPEQKKKMAEYMKRYNATHKESIAFKSKLKYDKYGMPRNLKKKLPFELELRELSDSD